MDECFVSSPAALMNGASDELFPSSSFTLDQDCRISCGNQLDLPRHLR
jgi:hypothetical protein